MATTETRAECIAQACAYANNASLPNTCDLARQLAELVAMLRAIDRGSFNGSGIVSNDPRVTRAASSVEALRPFLSVNL
jgi:hypothetical protein